MPMSKFQRQALLMKGETLEWRDAIYYTYYEYPSIHMVKRHYGIHLITIYYQMERRIPIPIPSD